MESYQQALHIERAMCMRISGKIAGPVSKAFSLFRAEDKLPYLRSRHKRTAWMGIKENEKTPT